MEVERPRKKRSQLLSKRYKASSSQVLNEQLSHLDSRGSPLELSLCSHATPGPSTDPPSRLTSSSEKKRAPASFFKRLSSHHSLNAAPTKPPLIAFFGDPEGTTTTLSSSSKSPKVIIEESQSQPTVSLQTASRRITDTDAECFEKLAKDTQTIRELIMEIYASVPMNPWAILPSQRKRRKRVGQQLVGGPAGGESSPASTPEGMADTEVRAESRQSDSEGPVDEDYDEDEEDGEDSWLQQDRNFFMRRSIQKIWDSYAMCDLRAQSERLDINGRSRSHSNRTMQRLGSGASERVHGPSGSTSGLRTKVDFEAKDQEDHETLSSKRLRRKQYICLSLIIFFSIALFGSALGACIYLFS